MHPAILVAAGAILLLYSLSLFRKLIPAIKWPYLRKPWRILFYLILLFFVGYVAYLRALFLQGTAYQPTNLLIGAILFSSATFIVIVLRASHQLVDGLKETEGEIMFGRSALESDQGVIERERKELEAKNEELEKTLEELYLLRDAMERGKAKNGSKRLKKLLDDLKSTAAKSKGKEENEPSKG